MSILRVPERNCDMCDVEIEYTSYIKNHKEELSALSTNLEKLDNVWDDFTIPFYCEDCIRHSRLDKDLCEADKF